MPTFRCGNIYVRSNGPFEAGKGTPGHTHNFDHMSLISRGRFHIVKSAPLMRADGLYDIDERGHQRYVVVHEGDHGPGWYANIEAKSLHAFTALEDGSEFLCIYPFREAGGEVSIEWTGWMDAFF